MESLIWLFVGMLAVLSSIGSMRMSLDDGTRLIMALLAAVLWARFGIGGFRVVTYSGGSTFTNNYQGMAYIGIALSLIMLLVVYRLAFGEVAADEDTDAQRHV